MIGTHNYISVKPNLVTSKYVTSKFAQIFDGKPSKSDAIVLNRFNKLFYSYTVILPLDGATKTGRRIFMKTTVQL